MCAGQAVSVQLTQTTAAAWAMRASWATYLRIVTKPSSLSPGGVHPLEPECLGSRAGPGKAPPGNTGTARRIATAAIDVEIWVTKLPLDHYLPDEELI
jgi:hypothetical protein